MPSPNAGKGRFVFSDTDMLCALELHVPSIRAMHSSVAPYMRIVADWEPQELSTLDNRLSRHFKADRANISYAFSKAAIQRSKATRLDEGEIGVDIDLFTLLEMSWGMHMLARSIHDVHLSYEAIYTALCSRIAGRCQQCTELDELHHYFGALNQARLKLNTKLGEVNQAVVRLADGGTGMQQAVESGLEAFAACTDVRDCLMMLKDAHQRGFEYARRPY